MELGLDGESQSRWVKAVVLGLMVVALLKSIKQRRWVSRLQPTSERQKRNEAKEESIEEMIFLSKRHWCSIVVVVLYFLYVKLLVAFHVFKLKESHTWNNRKSHVL